MKHGEYSRWQKGNIRRALGLRRVVAVAGARQIGKTTLTHQSLGARDVYRNLDDEGLLGSALSDPKGFVTNEAGTMVIDEIQRAPRLLLAIKQRVDADNRYGQYLLTGSANLLALPTISDSLAGRIKYIRLRPLAVGERLGHKPKFFDRAFVCKFPRQIRGYGKNDIFALAFSGGYPEALKMKNSQDRSDWYRDYVSAILLRDLRDVAQVRRHSALKSLLPILAAWSSKFIDIPSIGGELGITRQTIESYIFALCSLFLFEELPAWVKTDYGRKGMRSKIFAADTGLMSSILRWDMREVLLNRDRSGKLMETFVFQELAAQVDLNPGLALYHYRDREKREVDFIVENEQNAVLGIEVKSSHSVSNRDFRHLIWFRDNIAEDRPFTGIVLYAGEDVIPFGDRLWAVPIASLWLK